MSGPGLGRRATLPALASLAALAGGCRGLPAVPAPPPIPHRLLLEQRPIGRGPRFQPPADGPLLGDCGPSLRPRFQVHVEVFAADRVVIVPAGIGTRPPRRFAAGRIVAARCFSALVTLEPTGVVLVRPGRSWTLGDLFRAWGQSLARRRLLSFTGTVRAFVGGRGSPAEDPARIMLRPAAQIVVEVGRAVPPHDSYRFPPLP